MTDLVLRHCADYDQYGVPTTQPEMLTAQALESPAGIRIGIGADLLTRKTYLLTEGEARRLANYIKDKLNGAEHGNRR